MVTAPFVALMLSNPSQVQRKDRTPVPAFPSESIWVEFRETMKTLKEPKVWACEWLSGLTRLPSLSDAERS